MYEQPGAGDTVTAEPPSQGGYDLADPARTRRLAAYDPGAGDVDDSSDGPKTDRLDEEPMNLLHKKLLSFWIEELDRQNENRTQQALDADFYDGIQWAENDAAVLRERGQSPLVVNVIAQSINWIVGSEKRGRVDARVLPRRKEGAAPAEKKTQLLKYLSDSNDTVFHQSRAFADAATVGIGWMEDGLFGEDDEEQLATRYESWRNMLWDSAGTELDLTDCRYVFRAKWVDEDVAITFFPARAVLITKAAGNAMRAGWTTDQGDDPMDSIEQSRDTAGGFTNVNTNRRRVRIIEAWIRRPEPIERLQGGGEFHGDMFDPYSQVHADLVASGQAKKVTRPGMRMYCVIFTSEGLLWEGKSPYRHNKFPFTPVWGYRRGRDNMPYGVVRGLRDLQEDINKRFSKALFILSSNKVIVEEGAISNMKDFLTEIARPDGVAQVKKGMIGSVKTDVDRDLAPAHLELMTRSISMVQQVGGVTDELMGRTTNATSGVAVQARQQQGMQSTSLLFDNLRYAAKLMGEKRLSNIEQFMSEAKQFRITNMRGTPTYVTINDGLPENDIARTKADYVISETDWRATMREAQTDQLLDLMSKMPPQVSIVLLDLLVEHMDLPNADELVKRIRAINGQKDPDQTEPTQEDMQREQAQQEQAEAQKAMFMAQLRKLLADAGKSEAEGQRILAQAEQMKALTIKTGADTAGVAILAAQTALIPGVAPVADAILNEVGFVPAPVKTQQILAAQVAQQEQEQAAAQQQQAAQQQAAAQQQQPGQPGQQGQQLQPQAPGINPPGDQAPQPSPTAPAVIPPGAQQ
jgi:hypothetical protein